MSGDTISRITEGRKTKVVLVGHQKPLMNGLRRNRHQHGPGVQDLSMDGFHPLQLRNAERTPAPAYEANDRASLLQQAREAESFPVLIRQLKFRCPAAHLQGFVCNSGVP